MNNKNIDHQLKMLLQDKEVTITALHFAVLNSMQNNYNDLKAKHIKILEQNKNLQIENVRLHETIEYWRCKNPVNIPEATELSKQYIQINGDNEK